MKCNHEKVYGKTIYRYGYKPGNTEFKPWICKKCLKEGREWFSSKKYDNLKNYNNKLKIKLPPKEE